MINKRKNIILTIIALIGLIGITVGVTYSLFSYTKKGITENTITTGTISFIYEEIDKQGAGISIENAYPISDEVGKVQPNTFNFKIKSSTPSKAKIPYTVTARMKNDSALDLGAVKMYLTEVDGTTETELLLDKYNNLKDTTVSIPDNTVEKEIYTGIVPANTVDYEKNFKLRMWISDDTDFSDGNMNNKKFTVTVNVYSNAKVMTKEEIDLENSTAIESILVENMETTSVENETYQYEIDILNSSLVDIDVNTENEDAKVKIEKLDSLAYIESKIKRLATIKGLELTPGENYFKVTVTSKNKIEMNSYILKINLLIDETKVKASSIYEAIKNNDLETGYYNILVEDEVYSVHLYSLEGNQVFSENQVFGDSSDVGTSTEYAKNMVIVKVKGDLTVNEGVTVEPYSTEYGGPKGFTLYVEGTLINNGTIDNSHGAYAEGQDVYLYKNSDATYEIVSATGATGGKTYGVSGSNGTIRQTGGGGAAGIWTSNGATGPGGTGTSYSGGTGSGGGDKGTGQSGSSVGGPGGNASGSGGGAGGGAGNPGGNGAGGNGQKGANGTGGLLIIYTNNLTNNGTITANGAKGGTGNQAGGSSGGGSINIFYNNNYQDNGKVNADGGASAGWGGAGGNGTINIGFINNNNYNSIIFNFDYTTSGEQIFTAKLTGKYKLEVWGAQGGYGRYGSSGYKYGGYGGYSSGIITVNNGEELYINVGGKGGQCTGGYNGGGSGIYSRSDEFSGGGGGATHIATTSRGELKNYSLNSSEVIIVAGGGGGGSTCSTLNASVIVAGGSGGGMIGGSNYRNLATGGTQISAGTSSTGHGNDGSFGQGGAGYKKGSSCESSAGGGGGYYGGKANNYGGSGGSGYISNSLLFDKIMYCYRCTESEEEQTKTVATTNVSSTPISNYVKTGHGYARITYLGE